MYTVQDANQLNYTLICVAYPCETAMYNFVHVRNLNMGIGHAKAQCTVQSSAMCTVEPKQISVSMSPNTARLPVQNSL